MSRPVFYVAHPVAGDVPGNIARVLRWHRWLTLNYPGKVFSVPWLPDVMAFDDANPAERAAGMERNMVHLGRCDGIVLVGGRVSPGMRAEADAVPLSKAVWDLTHLGEEPPP